MLDYAEQPVFIIASERSGTNLLRKRISDNQAYYLGPSPAHFLKNLYYQQPYYGDLLIDANFISFIQDALNLCLVHFSPWKIDWKPEEILLDYGDGCRESIFLMHYFLKRYAREQGYEGYICKDNFLYEFSMEVSRKIPNAKFIYLYRDPRDFVLSQMKRPGAIPSVVRYAKLWSYEQTKAIAVSDRLRAEQRCFFVSYETLIGDEKNTIRRILEFIGVNQGKGRAYEEDVEEQVHEWRNLSGPTKKDNSGKFLTELQPKKLAMIESICAPQMQYLGYDQVTGANQEASRLSLYLDLFSGFAKKRIKSLLSKSDKSSAVYRRQAVLSKMKINYRSDIF